MSNGINLSSEPNGSVIITTEETRIVISADGSIAISTYAPLQLTGSSLAKLDAPGLGGPATGAILEALGRRLKKKTAN